MANTRNAPSTIGAGNVAELEPVWSAQLLVREAADRNVGSPVVADGIAYVQDPESSVEALDLETGELLWEKRYGAVFEGPKGVIVVDGVVFGATATDAFALDARTGEELWRRRLVRTSAEGIAMAPGYHDHLVYLSTVPARKEGGEVGVLWALDAATGEKVWHFDTVPRHLWGHPEINYGGGLYYPPAFDGTGAMYVAVSNAGPVPGTERFPWGASRPGPNLYSNSIVKLDEKTGRVEWHYQITPHGLCNGYLVSPVLARAGKRKVVISAGYLGIVVAVDQETGKVLWRRPVGTHNGHDNDGLVAMRGESAHLKTPMTVFPGKAGGVAGALSVGGGTVFVPIVNRSARLSSQTTGEVGKRASGELVALDVATGQTRWKHRFTTPLYGPTLATRNLIFVSAFDGTIAALDSRDGREVWTEKVPAHIEGGLIAVGDTLLVRSGYTQGEEMPELWAYRLRE